MVYEKYPLQLVFLTNLLNLMIYATGIIIIQSIGWIYVGLYIAYIVFLEIRLLKFHCPKCYYYGKVCAFGKGRVSSWLFKKGDPEMFACKEFGFKDFIPDLLVFIIPAITAFVLLILNFQWYIFISLLILIFLNFAGNAYIRGQIACKNCKQGEIGCPALEFFSPKKT
jgi:hypothetical protein